MQNNQHQTETDRELSPVDLDIVSGGINPQPLPPHHAPEQTLR